MLERLDITSRKLSSLQGIESLKKLKYLDFFRCCNLEDISSIVCCDNLIHIEIESCKKIAKFPDFKFPNLKKLHIENCGKIESCFFLAEQKSLEEFYFINSDFINTDISTLNSLSNLKKIVLPQKYGKTGAAI